MKFESERDRDGTSSSRYNVVRTLDIAESAYTHLTRITARRLKSMTSLNEHDQQLLETLLSQADAVSPGSEKSQHTEHGGFHSSDPDFHLLDSYINSEMEEVTEPMQYEQQSSSSFQPQAAAPGYSGQQQASGSGYSSQAQAAGSGYGSHQPAASYNSQGVASSFGTQQQAPGFGGQQQVGTAAFSGQHQHAASSGYSSQQPSVSSPPTTESNFQSQGASGFNGQQEGLSAIASVQGSAHMEQTSSGILQVQNPNYQQVASVTSAHGNRNDSESFQTHASPGLNQQFSAGTAKLIEQTSPGPSNPPAFRNQSSGFTQQFSVDTAAPAPNNRGASEASGYQSPATFQPQSHQQQNNLTSTCTDQLNHSPENYQQQQTLYQKGSAHSSTEQTFQGSCSDLGKFSPQSVQQLQQHATTFHQNASTHPSQQGNINTGFAQQQQQTSQFQTASPVPSQVVQNSTAGNYPGQMPNFQNQQSFSSPVGSPSQPDRSVPPSPSGFPQPSPEFGSQQAGNTAGYTSGQISGFQKQQSFHSPAPSPGQPQMDQSAVNSSAAAAFQQSPVAFGSQSQLAYQSGGKTSSVEEQTAGGSFSAQTSFSSTAQSSAFQPSGDQTANSSFQTDHAMTGNFQAQSKPEFTGHFPVQGDQNVVGNFQAQPAGFPQQAFQTQVPSVKLGAHQPMEDGSDNMSTEAKTSAVLQETFQSQTTTQLDKGIFDFQTATTQYQTATTNPYQATPASQYQAAAASQYPQTSNAQYQMAPTSQYQAAPPSQYQAAPSSEYQQTAAQYPDAQTSQYQQASISYAQRDQPMDVQSSLVTTCPSSRSFPGYVASSVPSNVFSVSSSQAADNSGSVFLNQAVAFQGQASRFPVVSSLSAQPAATVANEQSSVIPSESATQFGAVSSQFQTPGNLSFVFGSNEQQQQQQQQQLQPQSQQIQQQQGVQQSVLAQSQQPGNIVPDSNSQALSALIGDASQLRSIISAASQTSVSQSTPLRVEQFAQQTAVTSESQSLQPPFQVGSSIDQGSNSFQVPAQTLAHGVHVATTQQSTTPQIPIATGMDRSPLASLIDSSQANAALNLLASLLSNKNLLQGLQGLQALLPPNTQPAVISQLPVASVAQPNIAPQGPGGDADVLTKLLQAHIQQKGQTVMQPAQQIHHQPSHLGQQQPLQQVQPPPQQFQPQQQPNIQVHPQVQGFQQQQPNFLTQQTPQQPAFPVAQQQQLPLPVVAAQLQQQQAFQIPASVVSSLAGNPGSLSSLGLGISSDGQLVIGQQGLKIMLQTGAVTSAAPSSMGSQAPPVMAQSTGLTNTPLTTTVASSGQTELSQVLQSKQSARFGLPSDLQNISVQPFSIVATSTHASQTVTSAVPVVDSSISSHTTVTPTPSFIHPLPTAGVGLGVGTLSSGSSTPRSLSDPVTFLTSCSDPSPSVNLQNLMVSSSSSATTAPSIANIFYPVSTAGTCTQPEVSQSTTVAPVRNFLNVTTGSASSLLNAFKMAVADVNSGDFPPPAAPAPENIFIDGVKPMDTNQGDGKMDSLEMEVGEPACSSIRPMETDRPVLDLTSRQSSRKSSFDDDEQKTDPNSMLRRILTMKDEDPSAPSGASDLVLEPPSPENSHVDLSGEAVHEVFTDGNTQATLIERSEKLQLGSDAQQEDDFQDKMWTFPSDTGIPVEEVVPSKVHKGLDDLDASSVHVSVPSVEKLFDAGGAATSCSSFVFTKFGADIPNSVFTFGNSKSTTVITTATDTRTTSIATKSDTMRAGALPTASIRPSSRKQKDPGLTFQFPSKVGEYELRILTQPEEQHRARYLTEGSRGAVKDRSQQGYPVIKLLGYNEPAILQIFIGNETGRVKPHGFYQACKVCGKNSTQCTEREIDGTSIIEIEILPVNDMQVSMDCVGILKLRNADVEKRIGPSKAKAHKKNSTKARLVFRVTLRKPDGSYFTLQTVSYPILCTQPIGQPEISRMSLTELCVNQTSDLFIIGKNFLKGTQILFQELGADNIEVVWQSEAEIEAEFFQQTHLICHIPTYPRQELERPVHVQIVALSGGKSSEPQEFVYKPAMVMVKEEDPMDTEPSVTSKALPFGVSPVALQLNRLVERTQHHLTSTSLFQLPPGALSSIGAATTMSSTPKVVSSNWAQPVSSVLKPAAFALPSGGQTVFPVMSTLGGQDRGVVKTLPGALPLQLVLPPLGTTQTLALDSRQLDSQTPQFLVMNTQTSLTGAVSMPASQPSVIALSGQPATSAAASGVTATLGSSAVVGTAASVNSHSTTTTAPMIVILTGPPSTAGTGTGTLASSSSASNSMPLSPQQPVGNGQVESLLKQILEASTPSTS